MKLRPRLILKTAGAIVLLLLLAGIVAPFFTAEKYGQAATGVARACAGPARRTAGRALQRV